MHCHYDSLIIRLFSILFLHNLLIILLKLNNIDVLKIKYVQEEWLISKQTAHGLAAYKKSLTFDLGIRLL